MNRYSLGWKWCGYISLILSLCIMLSACSLSNANNPNEKTVGDSDCILYVSNDKEGKNILSEGNYRFYPIEVDSFEKGEMLRNKTPLVWDIYISDNKYDFCSKTVDSEYVNSVGGVEKQEFCLTLPKGKYIYIECSEPESPETIGKLKIKKVDMTDSNKLFTVPKETKTAPVIKDDIKLNLDIVNDEYGFKSLKATYENNSSRNITYFEVTYFDNISQEENLLVFLDSIVPAGEKSKETESSLVKANTINDIKITKYRITAVGIDGKEYYIDYDFENNVYNVMKKS